MRRDKDIQPLPSLLDFLHPLSLAGESGPPARIREGGGAKGQEVVG
ncbi:MAG: hypothetical protein KatS3mg109_0548 [Pirellulaceae bacterium]|nr:MAG: hypothetical protein KatS3mg107_1043 [Gemmataceae bacterium]GIW90116.1 MAG: hypothetical protein KatS3mg109_0548 [Pirellulaceae bacterium]